MSLLEAYNSKCDANQLISKKLSNARKEIARLKRENFDLKGFLLAEQELAEKRDALIAELADVLNGYLREECTDCSQFCEGDNMCSHQAKHRALVKKAREVVK